MLQPLYDKILVDTNITKEVEDSSGLIIYEDKNQPIKAKVIAIGSGRPTDSGLQPLLTKVGQTVLIPNFSGIPVFDNGDKYILIRESDVLGIVEQ